MQPKYVCPSKNFEFEPGSHTWLFKPKYSNIRSAITDVKRREADINSTNYSVHTHIAPQLLAIIVYFSSFIITVLLPNA